VLFRRHEVTVFYTTNFIHCGEHAIAGIGFPEKEEVTAIYHHHVILFMKSGTSDREIFALYPIELMTYLFRRHVGLEPTTSSLSIEVTLSITTTYSYSFLINVSILANSPVAHIFEVIFSVSIHHNCCGYKHQGISQPTHISFLVPRVGLEPTLVRT
jgi:hypothetical protein